MNVNIRRINIHLNSSELFKAPLPRLPPLRALLGEDLNVVEDYLPPTPNCWDHVALVQLGGDLALLVLGVGGEQVLAGLVVHHVRRLQLVHAPSLPQNWLQHSVGRERSANRRPVVQP